MSTVAPLGRSVNAPPDSANTGAQIVPLGLLSSGETGKIVEIDGQSDLVARLHEMGVRPGCQVRMVRPGAACLVAIGNQRLAFRGGDAAVVMVEVHEAIVNAS